MSTKSLLKLHEAIAVVLLNKENRTASFEEIADEINRRKLYIREYVEPLPAYQVMQQTTLGYGQYHHLFEKIAPDLIRLKNFSYE
jgi:hypothetical protein